MITRPKPRDWRQFETQRSRWTTVLCMIVIAPLLGVVLVWYGATIFRIGRRLLGAWGVI